MNSQTLVHALSVGPHLLILQPRLHQIDGEDASDAHDASDGAVQDARHQAAKRVKSHAQSAHPVPQERTSSTKLYNTIQFPPEAVSNGDSVDLTMPIVSILAHLASRRVS